LVLPYNVYVCAEWKLNKAHEYTISTPHHTIKALINVDTKIFELIT